MVKKKDLPIEHLLVQRTLILEKNNYPIEMKRLTVFSLNAWFDTLAMEERLHSITQHILKTRPQCVLLQELRPEMFDFLAWHLGRSFYITPSSKSILRRPYGEAIFIDSKVLEIKSYYCCRLPETQMGRELQVVEIRETLPSSRCEKLFKMFLLMVLLTLTLPS